MMRYFKALWYFVTGRFSAAAEALQSNKYVMSATYDASIEKGADRFNTVKNAVAELMAIEQTRISEIKALQEREGKLERIKTGSLAAMKRTQQELLKAGKSKEEILTDGEFLRHQSAYKDASSSVEEVSARCDEKEADLEERRGQIATYKAELQNMQRQQASLKEEKSEAVADVAIAQQMESINSVLAGISEDSTDKDLAAARDARKKAKAKAAITTELAGNDARLAENEYLDLAAGSEVDAELDGLLDWGEGDTDSKLDDAKLPE
jgi:phage shock protein A